MNDGYIKIFEAHGSQDPSQDAFGWVPDSDSPPIAFESDATVDRDGITVATAEGGFRKIGDLTAYPNTKPDFTKLEVGLETEVTTEEGNTVSASIEELQPKGAFNGAIILNRDA